MEPDWSLSYCWKRFFHCWMKRSRAEKPYTSMRPDLLLSNMSGRKAEKHTQGSEEKAPTLLGSPGPRFGSSAPPGAPTWNGPGGGRGAAPTH